MKMNWQLVVAASVLFAVVAIVAVLDTSRARSHATITARLYFESNFTDIPADVNPASFQFIGGTGSEALSEYYAKDKNVVYVDGRPFPGADPATFVGVYNSAGQLVCVTDSDHLWFFREYLFKKMHNEPVAATGGFCKTKTHVYIGADVVDGADAESFVGLDDVWSYGGYARDKNEVFYFAFPVDGADPSTFIVTRPPKETATGKEFDAMDRAHLYAGGEMVE